MVITALLVTLALVGWPADAAASQAPLGSLQTAAAPAANAPAANATAQPYAIGVTLNMVVGPNETLLTFLPGGDRFNTYVYSPLTVSVPASAASPLANLAVLNLPSPSGSSSLTPLDRGGAALVYGQVWQSWDAAYASGEMAEWAVRGALSTLWELVGTRNRTTAAGRDPSLVVPTPNHAVVALVAAAIAANATLTALDGLVTAINGLADAVVAMPGRLDSGGSALGLRASSLAGQSLLVAAEMSAAAANSALAAAAVLEANADPLVTFSAAQLAAAHAMRANTLATRFGNAMPAAAATAALLQPVTTGSAGAVQEAAAAAAQAGMAAQEAVVAAGSGSLQDAVAAARVAAGAAASAVSQALAIAVAAAPAGKPERIQARINATVETRRVATSVAQAMAAAANCGSAALAVLASAALVAQEVLPSPSTRLLNSNMSATPAGLEDGAMLNVAQRAAAAANATSTAALGVVTVANNTNPSPRPDPSPAPPSASSSSFTPFDNALYATAMAAEEVHRAWQLAWKKWGVSIGTDNFLPSAGWTLPSPQPVAIIAAPTSACPAGLVAVHDASELPAFRDGSDPKATSYFDNATGVVTSQGMVWLNTFSSLGNVSVLASFLPVTTAVDTSSIQGLSGCPLGTHLDRLMQRAAGYTSVAACSSSSSKMGLPWKAALAQQLKEQAAAIILLLPLHCSSSGYLVARSYNPQLGAYVSVEGRWRMCGSNLQPLMATCFHSSSSKPAVKVKVDRALTPLNLGNASTQPLAFVGSNRWPITDSLPLERVPAASNETAPAVLLLAGAPYFVVPGLLLKEDDLSSGTGCGHKQHPGPERLPSGDTLGPLDAESSRLHKCGGVQQQQQQNGVAMEGGLSSAAARAGQLPVDQRSRTEPYGPAPWLAALRGMLGSVLPACPLP
ncbi:hypothetical protein V8C86DRAFT_3023939 [Haematococcus lacustris]